MSLTIYTVSDPATVGSVMTSMAMFFGQDSWVGGALKLALIISLLVILAKGVLAREGLRLDVMLLQLLVIMVAFIPKTTVVIEQFDNNAPVRVVDDVPYAIAMPGAVAGAFALYMTQKIETVMSNVDGKYIAPSGEIDPFTPARTLMQFAAAPLDPGRFVDVNLRQTLYYASRFCGKPELTNVKFEQTRNGFREFADSLNLDGTSTYIFTEAKPYRDGGGSGIWSTCSDAAAYIAGVGDSLAAGGTAMFQKTMDGIARTTDTKRYSDTQTGSPTTRTWDDLLPILNRVAPAHAQLNNLALANVMSYTVLTQTARNSKNAINEMIEVQRDTGLFQWAKDESMQSLMVTTTAPKFMDILFFIFIAATPIVMFVVAANPASGFKVAGAYVLFGLWTQSWIPMMAIINGWYQAEIKNFAAPGTNGLTPEYLSALMRHVSTATIAASNMLQSAPYMMFAIMTGSMFAMSSMISKAAPSGGAVGGGLGAGGVAGGGGGGGGGKAGALGGALVDNQINPAAQMQAFQQAQSLVSGGMGIGDVNARGDAGAVIPGIPTLGSRGDVSTGVNASQEKSAAARASLDKQAARAMKDSAALAKASSNFVKGENLADLLRTAGHQVSYDSKSNSIVGNGWQYSLTDGFTSTSQGQFGVKGDLGAGLSGGGAKAMAALTGAVMKLAQDVMSMQNNQSQSGQLQHSSGGGVSGSTGSSARVGSTGGAGADFKATAQKAKEISDTFQNIAKQSQALDEADKIAKSAGSNTSMGTSSELKGSDVANLWAGKNNTASGQSGVARQKVIAALGGELGSKLDSAIAANQEKLRNAGAHGALTEDQIAAVAAWQAMDAMKSSGNTSEKIEAMAGMARLAAAAGAHDMSPAISQIAQANDIIKGVEQKIADMGANVQPVVAKAVKDVGDNTSDANNDKLRGQVEEQQAKDKGSAETTYGGAKEGVKKVEAEGKAEKLKKDKDFVQGVVDARDTSGLARDAGKAQEERPTVPDGKSATARVLGTSAKHFKEGIAEGNERTNRADVAPTVAAMKSHGNYSPMLQRKSAEIDAQNAKREAAGQPLIDKEKAMAHWAKVEARQQQGDKDFTRRTGEPVPQPAGARPENQSPAKPAPAPAQSGGTLAGAANAGTAAATVVTGAPAAAGAPTAAGGAAAGAGAGAAAVVTGGASSGTTLPTLGIGGATPLASAGGGGGGGAPATAAPGMPATAKPNAGGKGGGASPNKSGGSGRVPGR